MDSISSSGFIWASELEIVLQGPKAGASGTVYTGYIPLAPLIESETDTEYASYSIESLRRVATTQDSFSG